MPSTINASTASGGGIISAADSSGVLELQTAGTSALVIETTGNINIPGTGKRITGDFSNATVASRLMFQTSTTNSTSIVSTIPNGTSNNATFAVWNNSNPANSSYSAFQITSTLASIDNGISGSGTLLPFAINTGGSERLRIDTNGNVGIGTAIAGAITPSLRLGNSGSSGGVVTATLSLGSYGTGYGSNLISSSDFTSSSASYLAFGTTPTGASGLSAPVERMRITSGGAVLVGTTSTLFSTTPSVQVASSGDQIQIRNTGAASGKLWRFACDVNNTIYVINQDTTGVYIGDGGTSWLGLSDERAKDIIEPITNAVEKVSTLRTVIGKYKTDKEGTRRSFLIAQDVQAVLPEAVYSADPQNLGLSYTDTIPLLVAAIKELKAEVDSLKAQINQ
jgi:hypothetical protein